MVWELENNARAHVANTTHKLDFKQNTKMKDATTILGKMYVLSYELLKKIRSIETLGTQTSNS